jgi:hypothetical protein
MDAPFNLGQLESVDFQPGLVGQAQVEENEIRSQMSEVRSQQSEVRS